MEKLKTILKKVFKYYLIYIFIFAILIFAIIKPKKSDNTKEPNSNYPNIESRNKDRVALVESGKDGALIRLNLIENSQETLAISYYILMEGKSTEVLLGSILAAADRGVNVRILLDGMFHNLKGDLKGAIYGFKTHPNIELKFYEPFNLLSPLAWNNRLHDKIIIADENLALIGGRNIGDKYFLEDIEKDRFVKDRDVIIFNDKHFNDSPSVIDDMRHYYDQVWNHEYTKPSIKDLSPKQEDLGESYKEGLENTYRIFKEEYLQNTQDIDWYKHTLPTDSIKFVHNPIGRANQDPWCLRELLVLAEEADDYIFIQSPYIIPSRSMKSKFQEYDINLENIRILTNSLSSSPNPIAISGYYNNRKDIVDSGVELYEYQGPKSIHSKTYIFDDSISVIGSFNLDARSSYINTESMVIIYSEEFTNKLKEEILLDLDNSLVVGKDYSYIENDTIEEGHVSIFKKLLTKILSKIVFFLEYLL